MLWFVFLRRDGSRECWGGGGGGRGGGPGRCPSCFREPLSSPPHGAPGLAKKRSLPRTSQGSSCRAVLTSPHAHPPAYRHVLTCPPPLRRQGKGARSSLQPTTDTSLSHHGHCMTCLSCGSGVQTVTVTRSFRLWCCQGGRSPALPSIGPLAAGQPQGLGRASTRPLLDSPPPCPALPSCAWTAAPTCLSLETLR